MSHLISISLICDILKIIEIVAEYLMHQLPKLLSYSIHQYTCLHMIYTESIELFTYIYIFIYVHELELLYYLN